MTHVRRPFVALLICASIVPGAPVFGDAPPAAAPPAAVPPAAVPPTPQESGALPAAVPAAIPPESLFSAEQLDQMVSPIALYPDPLLMQICMAATYPLEVVEADRWVKKNPNLKENALDKALEEKRWDPSVKSLTHFPSVLARMSDNLDWTKDLGDAFLGQQSEVLDAIQRMRRKAYELGNLKSTPEQTVTLDPPAPKETGQTAQPQVIKIEPAQPQVVYVPVYSSTVIYGPPPPTVYYPAVMAYPPGYVATASLLSFGAGMAVGAALWGGCNWHSHDVNVNYNYNVNRNVNRGDINRPRPEPWRHNPQHRAGVNYRNDAVAKQYGRRSATNRAARDSARGYERPAAAQTRPAHAPRAQAPSARAPRPPGGATAAGGARQNIARQGGATRPAPASQPASASRRPTTSRDTAFGGTDSGRTARADGARGAASRGVDRGSFARAGGGAARGTGAGRGAGGAGGGRRR